MFRFLSTDRRSRPCPSAPRPRARGRRGHSQRPARRTRSGCGHRPRRPHRDTPPEPPLTVPLSSTPRRCPCRISMGAEALECTKVPLKTWASGGRCAELMAAAAAAGSAGWELPPRGLPSLGVSRCRRRLPGAVTISPPPGDFLYGEWLRRKEGGRPRCTSAFPGGGRGVPRTLGLTAGGAPIPGMCSPPSKRRERQERCPVVFRVPVSRWGAVRDSTMCLVVFYECLAI